MYHFSAFKWLKTKVALMKISRKNSKVLVKQQSAIDTEVDLVHQYGFIMNQVTGL